MRPLDLTLRFISPMNYSSKKKKKKEKETEKIAMMSMN